MLQTVTEQFVREGFGYYLNARNLDAFFALYAEDARYPSLARMGLPTNKEGFRAFVNGFYTAFSEPRFAPQRILCDGDTTMFRWIFSGTHTGDFNGIKPTGKPVQIDAFSTFRVDTSGQVVEQHEVGDTLTLLKQIGALP